MSHKPTLQAVAAAEVGETEQLWRLKGRLMGTAAGYEMLDDIRDRIREGRRNVILDMTAVDIVDSTGAGILAAIITSARRRSGKLALVGLNDRNRKVLEFMQLHQFAAICDSVGAARAAAG